MAAEPPSLSVKPCASTIRAALKKANLERYVNSVTTGRKQSRVRLTHEGREHVNAITTALAELWDDADTRVTSYGTNWVIYVSQDRWWNTYPATEEGRAARMAAEEERTAGLLAAGTRFELRGHTPVVHEVDSDGRSRWVDRLGNHHSPFDIYAVR